MTKLLVLAETNGESILPGTLAAVAFAQKWQEAAGGTFDLLILGGKGIETAAESWRSFGAERVLLAAIPELVHPTADRVASTVAQVVRHRGLQSVAGTASSFGRDVLPRLAALLDLPMLSDVMQVTQEAGHLVFRRPMYAGNVLATVQVTSDIGVFSVRGTSFDAPKSVETTSVVENLTLEEPLPAGTTWLGTESAEQKRPDLTAARVVVSGGRPLRDAETFERILGGLADRLGGAVGATRAAVDSGIAPNELQVGQTGKVVAPELYIAAGVSGSVQHLAGMKESKVIVAINTDAEAPIFEMADYGLVADLHEAVPELTSKI